MDPFSISVAALIAAKAVEGFGDHLGNDTASALERMVSAVGRRFRGDRQAERALRNVSEAPRDRARVSELAVALERHLSVDETFRAEMTGLVNTLRQDRTLAQFNIQITGDAEVGKVVNIGEVHGNISL